MRVEACRESFLREEPESAKQPFSIFSRPHGWRLILRADEPSFVQNRSCAINFTVPLRAALPYSVELLRRAPNEDGSRRTGDGPRRTVGNTGRHARTALVFDFRPYFFFKSFLLYSCWGLRT